jgi:hypothetical protein
MLRSTKLSIVIIGMAVAMFMFTVLPVAAQNGGAIAQGFSASGADIVDGTLVSLKDDAEDMVEVATMASSARLAGVAASEALVALSQGADTLQVIIGGTASVLVSDINGAVRAGDKITISPIEGVGMKATANTQVVGAAQTNFDDITTETRSITDQSGQEHNVRIGRLPVQVNVAYYVAPTSNILPPFIQNLSNSIAGKPVSVVRILVASSLIVVGAISIFILLYVSTRNGIISIGRNPLAAGAIRKGLLQVGIYSVMILAFALIASYIILTS